MPLGGPRCAGRRLSGWQRSWRQQVRFQDGLLENCIGSGNALTPNAYFHDFRSIPKAQLLLVSVPALLPFDFDQAHEATIDAP